VSSPQQYKSIIFYHDEAQRRLAIDSKQQEEAKLGRKIATEIITFSKFYLAEAYHQKHFLQWEQDIMKEFRAIYPANEDFVASTAVARLNGYAGGYGEVEILQDKLNDFGLSAAGKERLLEIADRDLKPACAIP
jgi:peptide-methionine (S)-S-oxide reductase